MDKTMREKNKSKDMYFVETETATMRGDIIIIRGSRARFCRLDII